MAESNIFPVIHHAHMLKDGNRLLGYKKALQSAVTGREGIVDIGTGTGILAYYAAQLTKGRVVGIEYIPSTFNLANILVKSCGSTNLELIQGRSYDISLDFKPKILVTETIGNIALEENLVTICYDFKKRHPSIETIIPSLFEVYLQPVYSETVKKYLDEIIASYDQASLGTFQYQNAYDYLKEHLSQMILSGDLSDAQPHADPQLIASYQLGVDKPANLDASVTNITDSKVNCIHVFFRSVLHDRISLSNHFTAPFSHWEHKYIPVGKESSTLNFRYNAHTLQYLIHWSP